MRRQPSRHTAGNDAHPAHEKANLPPGLLDAVLLGHLAVVAHAGAPAIRRQSKQAPGVHAGQRNVVKEHARNDPLERCAFQAMRVANEVVQGTGYHTHEQIGHEDDDELLAREKVPHRGEERNKRAHLTLAHAVEEQRVRDEVDLGLKQRFDVRGTRPADLLLKPTGKRRRCIRGRKHI